MASPLVPCPSCARHVRADEPACPFCDGALPRDLAASAVPAAPGRLGRAAAFVFGATLSVAACSGDGVKGVGEGATDGGAGGAGTGPDDDGGGQTLYGFAPDGGTPPDDGGAMAHYGAPPPDAGHGDRGSDGGDGGGSLPLYGSPPPPH